MGRGAPILHVASPSPLPLPSTHRGRAGTGQEPGGTGWRDVLPACTAALRGSDTRTGPVWWVDLRQRGKAGRRRV